MPAELIFSQTIFSIYLIDNNGRVTELPFRSQEKLKGTKFYGELKYLGEFEDRAYEIAGAMLFISPYDFISALDFSSFNLLFGFREKEPTGKNLFSAFASRIAAFVRYLSRRKKTVPLVKYAFANWLDRVVIARRAKK